MPRFEDRYRTNSLSQLEEVRIRNRDALERSIMGVDLSAGEDSSPYTINYSISENISNDTVYDEIWGRGFRPNIDWVTALSQRPDTYNPVSCNRADDVPPNIQREYDAYIRNSCGGTIQSTKHKYIKPYNYVPNKFNFNSYHDENEKLFMGVELEIDSGGCVDENAKFIQEYLGENNCYIMHDGSLNNGLEIVTHPSTLNYHKDLPYRELFEELVKKGYKSHDTYTCGYHIHINRNFFSEDPTIQDLCITKILYLLEKYWNDVKRIARRDSNKYSQRFNMKENESMFELLIKAKGGYSSKYNMVNLSHSKTIEFRMFKGTLKYETFIATMEFVYNLAYICKNTPLENIQNIKFTDILDINPAEYLIEYINSRR